MSKEDEPYIPPASESNEKHDAVVKDPSNVAGALAGASGKDEARLEDSRPPAVQSPTTEYPEGGYGWVVVACVALLNAHTWGLNSAYAVFLAYYLRSGYFDGASPMAFAFVGGLSISIALLISPIATACIGKFGTRPVLAFGVVFQTIAFTGASFTSQLWQLLLAQGVCFGLGMGFMFVGSVGVIPQWFLKRRSFASSIGAAGSGFGGLTWALATNAMISSIGLPWAFRVIAIVSFVVNATCTMLIRDRNKLVGAVHVAFHKDLFKMVQFYLLVGWVFFSMFAYIIAVFSLPDYGQTVGLTATQGSLLSAMFNLSQGLGRPMIGWASDPLGRLNVAALGTLIASLAALFIWIFAGKVFAGVLVYSLLGCFAGIIWATIPPVAAEVVGIQLLPSALSLTWLFLVLPATFAEVIGLALKTPSLGKDSYLYVQLFTGLSFFAAFVCAWLLRAWKMYDNENKEIYKTNREADSSTNDVPEHPASTPAGDKRTFTGYLLRGKWIFAIDRV